MTETQLQLGPPDPSIDDDTHFTETEILSSSSIIPRAAGAGLPSDPRKRPPTGGYGAGKALPGPKGRGKGGVRARRRAKDTLEGVTKPAIKRLARRGGVKRLSGLCYDQTRFALRSFLETLIKDAVCYTEHARRKTVTAEDVVRALKRQGRTLYLAEKAVW